MGACSIATLAIRTATAYLLLYLLPLLYFFQQMHEMIHMFDKKNIKNTIKPELEPAGSGSSDSSLYTSLPSFLSVFINKYSLRESYVLTKLCTYSSEINEYEMWKDCFVREGLTIIIVCLRY
jgi:hypothetical protein